GDLRRLSFRVREDQGPADVGDVADGAMPLLVEFPPPRVKAVVQLVQVLLGLGNQPSSPGTFFPSRRRPSYSAYGTGARSMRAFRLISTCRATFAISAARSAAVSASHGLNAASKRKCSTR